MENEKKIFWSPSVRWRKTGGEVRIEIFSYSGFVADLFPEIYFLTQKGTTLGELLDQYPSIGKNKFLPLLRDWIRKKILVQGILTPQEIFHPQGLLFQNDYDEKIKYDVAALDLFVEKQLNRDMIPGDNKKVLLKPGGSLPEIIRDRRTCRTFDEIRAVGNDVFSSLLSVFRQNRSDGNIRYHYASAGGLYPIDVYVHVKKDRVEGIPGGLYYYRPLDNSLSLVEENLEIPKNAHYFTNQKIYLGSAFSIFLFYNAEATMPKYGGTGYFYALIEAGIMVATLSAAAEAEGVGICSIGEMNFRKIEKFFRLNGNQVLVHTMEAGFKPKRG